MSLTLHFHPLSSFCHKALIALYENDTPFQNEHRQSDGPGGGGGLQDAVALRPIPGAAGRRRTIPESSVIIEYLDLHHPGKTRFIPADPSAPGRCASRIASTICSFICTCRRSSATGCARRARRTRMASRMRAGA